MQMFYARTESHGWSVLMFSCTYLMPVSCQFIEDRQQAGMFWST